MGGEHRALVLWALSSLMVAEERITTKFSGLVGAHGTEEEATFLATQQVDEARHMQFYARFQDEVVADPDVIAAHVARAREQVSAAFRPDLRRGAGRGPRAARRRARATPAAKVEFVTHLPPGHRGHARPDGVQLHHATTSSEQELLPGFVEGYSKIHHDEQRHIGYGTWFLREAVRAHPELADVVRETLRSLLPAVAESLTPPDREGTDWDALGASTDEIREFALGGLSRRLNIVGVPLETL